MGGIDVAGKLCSEYLLFFSSTLFDTDKSSGGGNVPLSPRIPLLVVWYTCGSGCVLKSTAGEVNGSDAFEIRDSEGRLTER